MEATLVAAKQNELVNTTTLAEEKARVEGLVDMFIEAQDVKTSSKALYRRTLQQYLLWVYDEREESTRGKAYRMGEINRTHILQYKEELLAEGKSSLTIGSYITSVRRFYEWLEANKVYPNVAKGVKSPKRKNQFRKQPLRPAQVVAMLSEEQSEAHSPRDYALVNLLVRTGLRTIEVSRANVEDITYMGGQRVLRIQGKGRDEKDNFVVLTDKAYQPLQKYLEQRQASAAEPLFTSTSNRAQGGRMTTRTISHIAKQAMQDIGLDSRAYTAHSLRHTAAVNILRAGGSLEMVQQTLRHANPATTQIYTATINEERRLAASGECLLDRMY